MALGALAHAGADLDGVVARLATLGVEQFALHRETVELRGLVATRVHLRARPQPVIRTYASIRGLLERADLPERARHAAHRVLRRLAEAEAAVHGKDVEFVTFHEFGDLEALVEVVGTALALHDLGVERVFSSPVPTGMGMVRSEHGVKPVPSPEVSELLRHVPTFSRGIPAELVSPTGAAIVAALSEGFGEMPLLRPVGVGYGAGELRLDFPHVLRVVVGEPEAGPALPVPVPAPATEPGEADEYVVEAVLPRPGPERWRAALRRALEAGATRAWATPATLSGGEEAVVLAAAVPRDRRLDVEDALLDEPDVEEVRVTPVRVMRPGPRGPEARLG
jgi:uncharacterized protein (DUF111 family)